MKSQSQVLNRTFDFLNRTLLVLSVMSFRCVSSGAHILNTRCLLAPKQRPPAKCINQNSSKWTPDRGKARALPAADHHPLPSSNLELTFNPPRATSRAKDVNPSFQRDAADDLVEPAASSRVVSRSRSTSIAQPSQRSICFDQGGSLRLRLRTLSSRLSRSAAWSRNPTLPDHDAASGLAKKTPRQQTTSPQPCTSPTRLARAPTRRPSDQDPPECPS